MQLTHFIFGANLSLSLSSLALSLFLSPFIPLRLSAEGIVVQEDCTRSRIAFSLYDFDTASRNDRHDLRGCDANRWTRVCLGGRHGGDAGGR